jgi:hypothetical protein
VLEFLRLKDEYSESELEKALIRELEQFLLELGNDFAFIARQNGASDLAPRERASCPGSGQPRSISATSHRRRVPAE